MKRIYRYLFIFVFSLMTLFTFNKMDVSASENLIRGADIGWLSQLEDEGVPEHDRQDP